MIGILSGGFAGEEKGYRGSGSPPDTDIYMYN